MMMLRALAALALAAGIAPAASAETLFSCGGSEGQSYFPESFFVPKNDAGWKADAITAGKLQLVVVDGQPDIQLLDTVRMFSARADGGEVTILDHHDGFATVLVNYPKGAKELYTFDANAGKVYWSQHKFGVFIDKLAAYTATCAG